MRAVDAELTAGGAGGRLAAESLANVLAVHLIRHIVAPGRPVHGRDGTLPRGRLRAVLEYIEEHLDAAPTLAEMAAVARLNPYHFARQFKAATGLPPHQYVITRRVERAKHLLRAGTDFSLAEVAARAGFYGPEPVLPPLQAPRRRHAEAVPDALKNRLKARKSRQETGRQAPLRFSQDRGASRPSLTGNTTGRFGGSRSDGFESPFAGSTLLSGLAQADQPPAALALAGTGSACFVIHYERSR